MVAGRPAFSGRSHVLIPGRVRLGVDPFHSKDQETFMDTGRIGPHRGEPARTVVTGPLAPYARGWRAELAARGYAPHSITAHAQLMAHVSGWLAVTGRGVDAMTDEVVRE